MKTVTFPDYADADRHRAVPGAARRARLRADVIQMLMIANRYEWKPAIVQALAEGTIVIADRYLASSVAYGEAQGLDPDWLFDAQRYLPPPALTVDDRHRAGDRRRAQAHQPRPVRAGPADARAGCAPATAGRRRRPGWVAIDGERPIDAVAADVATARGVSARAAVSARTSRAPVCLSTSRAFRAASRPSCHDRPRSPRSAPRSARVAPDDRPGPPTPGGANARVDVPTPRARPEAELRPRGSRPRAARGTTGRPEAARRDPPPG